MSGMYHIIVVVSLYHSSAIPITSGIMYHITAVVSLYHYSGITIVASLYHWWFYHITNGIAISLFISHVSGITIVVYHVIQMASL